MFRTKRFNYLLLAMFLATSVITLAGHSAVHAGSGAGQCQMCASHADLNGATPGQAHSVPVDIGPRMGPRSIAKAQLSGSTEFQHLPRAPPVFT